MKTATREPFAGTAQVQIRALLEDWSAGIREKDLDRIMAYYAPDIVAFDAIVQLQFKGIDAYRKHWEYCLGLCEGAMVFEQHQLSVYADEHLASAHWLNRCGGVDDKGEEKASWMRGTATYRKTAEGWKAVHEHFSAPFDMESGKALFDLQP
jgi:ketosteroid isomerase-like protein